MPYMGEAFTEPDNSDRAEWALAALNTFAALTHYDPREQSVDPEDKEFLEEVAGDLICDLMHLLHQAGIDPEEVIPTARYNFNYELEEEAEVDEAAVAEVRLEYLRSQIEAEKMSWGEIAELQSLAEYIDPGDTQLLEWAGVPENEEEDDD